MAGDPSDFVHLHVHSDYSLLDGACRLDNLLERAQEMGMGSIAVTDHGNLFGVPEFYNTAKSFGIRALLGCEVYLVYDHKRSERPERQRHSIHHLGLIATNFEGYQNLCHIVSEAHTTGFYYKPRADMELLAQHSKGLVCLSGCLNGVVASYLVEDRMEKAREALGVFVDIFGKDRYFVEIQDHGIPEQQRTNPLLIQLAKEFGLRLVATNDVHYVRQEDWAVHDALLCIQTGSKLKEEDRMRFPSRQFYLKSGAEMLQLFPDNPEAIYNTALVAEMCDVKLPFGKNNYPSFPLSPEQQVEFQNTKNFLTHLCVRGLKERYDVDYVQDREGSDRAKMLIKRIDYELGIIEKTGFLDYFLIVWDFINWARRNGVPVGPGRGSGAGCLVAYTLKITDIDPIRFNLLFERFLNPERVSPPDFDIDFCMRRRGEVVEYVRQRYGSNCVANIITFGTFGAKMVIRDLARVNDIPYSDADRLAKMVPDDLGITLKDALEKSQELKKETAANPIAKQIIQQGQVIEGMVRNTGTHAAGIIVSNRPIMELVPVTLQEGALTTQYPKDPLEALGLLKADFLGLKTLTVIADCQDNIRRCRHMPEFDIEKIPLDDPKTFALFNEGRTVAVFQFESGAMQNWCRQFSFSSIDEISALSALYRPGPMDWIPEYIKGKKDPNSIKLVHPLLEKVSRETYGILVYQEQVMEAARVIAGYSLGGADILRRAMGKKKVEVMIEQRAVFVKGAKETNNIDAKTAEEIFSILEKFAGYGFNKSHSAAYAVIAYRTAYLKANFPTEYMAAVLSSELGNSDKLAHFIEECTAMSLPVLGPDINASNEHFTPAAQADGSGCIRFGLAGIKGVGDIAARHIIEEREKNGPYETFFDCLSRLDLRAVNKRALECLVRAGCFDPMGIDRQHLLDSLENAISEAHSIQVDRQKGQGSLFDLVEEAAPAFVPQTSGPAMSMTDKLANEKELLGFYISGHPLNVYAGLDTAIQSFSPAEFEFLPNNEGFRLCGILNCIEKKISKRDNRLWALCQLSTRTQTYGLNIFPEAFEKNSSLVKEGALVVVHGSVRKQNGETQLNVNRLYRIEDKIPTLLKSTLWVLHPEHAESFLQDLRNHIQNVRGNTQVRIGILLEANKVATYEAHHLCCGFDAQSYAALRKHPAVVGVEVEVAEVPDPPAPSWRKANKGK